MRRPEILSSLQDESPHGCGGERSVSRLMVRLRTKGGCKGSSLGILLGQIFFVQSSIQSTGIYFKGTGLVCSPDCSPAAVLS